MSEYRYKAIEIVIGPKRQVYALARTTDDPARDRCELLGFLSRLKLTNPVEHQKIHRLFQELARADELLDVTKFKLLADGLYELRTTDVRVLCFFHFGQIVVCTHGFLKKSQKTPAQELAHARSLRRAFLRDNPLG